MSFNTFSQEDSVYIEFVPENDNALIFPANGQYLLTPHKSYKSIIPGGIHNMVRIDPAKLFFNNTLITAANQYDMRKYGFEYPAEYYVEISKKEYNEIMAPALADNEDNIPIEGLRAMMEVKFEDISDFDKKRLAARFDFAEIEKQRKKDSIINIERRKLLLDLVKTPIKVIENLDTLPIPDPKYFKRAEYFDVFPEILDSVKVAHQKMRSELFQTKVDALLTPFYFGKREVSNGDYKEFIDFLADSIYLHYSYWNVNNDSLALTLLNCSKKERDSLDSKQMKQNYKEFGLKNPFRTTDDFINHEIWSLVLDTLYDKSQGLNSDNRYSIRRELLVYPNKYGLPTEILPTKGGFNELTLCVSEDVAFFYHSDPYFDEKPIVNLSYKQIEVYCLWKQKQLSKKYRKLGYTIIVGMPSVADYEFAMKSLVPASVNAHVVDQDNSSYITNKVGCSLIPYQLEDKEKGFLSFMDKEKITVSEFKHDQWVLANSTKNLEFINGGASEYSSTRVTKERLVEYGIPQPRGPLSAYVFVLGSNYRTDLFTKSGTAYTKIFYKTLQEKDKSSCYNGFRLVYKFVPLEETK